MPRSLDRLLRPQSIAAIGGSWAANVVEQCQRFGFAGQIWPVHPSRATIHGIRSYASLEALPAAPDAAFVGVNRSDSIALVQTLAQMGAGGAVCFAAGFGETGTAAGHALQTALVDAADAMPLLGPNCYGLINYLDGALLWPDQHGGQRVARGVAVLTQSSNIAINLTMQRRGLPIAYVATLGNQAQTGLAELAAALLDDPRITALALHVEGFGEPRALEAMAAKARTLSKPVVALKVGRSAVARAALVSHTASLAGETAGADALLARLGIGQVRSLTELLESLKLLHARGPLPGRRLASMSCSGGEAALIADRAAEHGVSLPPPPPATAAALGAALGERVTIANPLDYHTFIWNDRPALTATFTAMLGGGFDLALLLLDLPRADRCDLTGWQPCIDALRAATGATGARAAVVASLPETLPEPLAGELLTQGMAPLVGLDDALAAARVAADIGTAWAQPLPPPLVLPPQRPPPEPALRRWSEHGAKRALAAAGLRLPRLAVARSPAEALAAAEHVGFPVVLKASGLAHKSEAGAVVLGLRAPAALAAAAERLLAQTDALLVEEQIEGAVAELLVGILRDPAHGLLLTLGAGGVLAELWQDRTSLLLPASDAAILAALQRLRIAPLLAGYRGRPAGDLAATVRAVQTLAGYTIQIADRIQELEVNPLLVLPDDAVAVDALLTTWEEA